LGKADHARERFRTRRAPKKARDSTGAADLLRGKIPEAAVWIAADLIAQAEHDPDARAILITWSRPLAVRVATAIRQRSAGRAVVGRALRATAEDAPMIARIAKIGLVPGKDFDVTKLEWQRVNDGTKRSWKDSLDYCANLLLGGFSGWHLPNISELTGIVQYDALNNGVAIDPAFEGAQGDLYWTSSQNEGLPTLSWTVTFNLGLVDGISVTGLGYARCVRHMESQASSGSSCGCEVPGGSGRATGALWASALAPITRSSFTGRWRPRIRCWSSTAIR